MPAYRKLSQLLHKTLKIQKGSHFYFIRHGQSVLNAKNSIVGWTDCQLSHIGRQQASQLNKGLRDHIPSFKTFHTSDLARCKHTLKLGLGLDKQQKQNIKISQSDKLRQLNFGDDEGLLIHTLPNEYLKILHSLHYKAPNGQSWPEARQRAMKYISSIASDGHHLVSSHGGLLCSLFYHLGLKQVVPNCSIISAQFDCQRKDFTKIHFEWRYPDQK